MEVRHATNSILKSCWMRRQIVKLCCSNRTTQQDDFEGVKLFTRCWSYSKKKKSHPPRKHRYPNHNRPAITSPRLKDAFLLSSNRPCLLKVAAGMEKTDGLILPSDNETRWATVRRYIKKKKTTPNQNKRFTEMSLTFLTFRHQSRQQGMQGADGHV